MKARRPGFLEERKKTKRIAHGQRSCEQQLVLLFPSGKAHSRQVLLASVLEVEGYGLRGIL